MNEKPWDQRLNDFFKKAGEDIRRTTEDLKVEAQKLIEEVRDPQNQQKVKDALGNLGAWTEKVARDAAVVVEAGVKKAEEAIARVTGQETAAPKAAGEGAPAEKGSAGAASRPRSTGGKTSSRKKAAGKKVPARKAAPGKAKAKAARPAPRKRK